MDSNEIKGKMKDLGGKAQEKFGEVTNDKEQQLKGLGKQVEGKVQETYGKAKDAAQDAVRDAEDKFRARQSDVQSDVQPNRDREIGKDDIERDKDENAA
jgi:uncharacterized protein YjbJ (UPF0337 family)